MSDKPSILVTGASGFLGGRVVEHLLARDTHRIRVLVRAIGRAVRVAPLPVEFHIGDVTDSAAFAQAAKGCEAVIHCASHIEGGVPPEQTSTFRGTQAAAIACSETGARLVHISSSSVYGVPEAQVVDETMPHRPRHSRDTYGRAKIAAEKALRNSCAAGKGLRASIIQPTMIYGPLSAEWTLSPLSLLREGDIALPENDTSVCNAVYVDDVVRAALLAMEKCSANCPAWLINGPELPTWTGFFQRHAAIGTRGQPRSVDAGRIAALIREQKAGKSLLRAGMQLLRTKPEVRATLLKTSLIGGAFDLLQGLVSREKFARIKERLRASPAAGNAIATLRHAQAPALPLRLPPAHFLELIQQRHRYSNAKAESELGYVPQFGLDAAFDIIAAWAAWSRLL